jgi:receptor-type tyrosine-protein phosphatase N
MEDHLKNKDRLEQEWVALCAYEAEPCATTVAQKVSHCASTVAQKVALQ